MFLIETMKSYSIRWKYRFKNVLIFVFITQIISKTRQDRFSLSKSHFTIKSWKRTSMQFTWCNNVIMQNLTIPILFKNRPGNKINIRNQNCLQKNQIWSQNTKYAIKTFKSILRLLTHDSSNNSTVSPYQTLLGAACIKYYLESNVWSTCQLDLMNPEWNSRYDSWCNSFFNSMKG